MRWPGAPLARRRRLRLPSGRITRVPFRAALGTERTVRCLRGGARERRRRGERHLHPAWTAAGGARPHRAPPPGRALPPPSPGARLLRLPFCCGKHSAASGEFLKFCRRLLSPWFRPQRPTQAPRWWLESALSAAPDFQFHLRPGGRSRSGSFTKERLGRGHWALPGRREDRQVENSEFFLSCSCA